jgi:hypothetical protein
VSLEAGKRPQETKKTSRNPPLSTENRFKIKKLSEVPSSLQNQAPAQRFPRPYGVSGEVFHARLGTAGRQTRPNDPLATYGSLAVKIRGYPKPDSGLDSGQRIATGHPLCRAADSGAPVRYAPRPLAMLSSSSACADSPQGCPARPSTAQWFAQGVGTLGDTADVALPAEPEHATTAGQRCRSVSSSPRDGWIGSRLAGWTIHAGSSFDGVRVCSFLCSA